MRPLDIATAPRRDSRHWQQSTITWEELKGWTEKPSPRKDCGNYLLGRLDGSVRRNTTVVHRSALTLDIDHPDADFLERWMAGADFAYLLHTTFSSAPDEPRYRLIIPTDRDMTPDEYQWAAQTLASHWGADQFDPAGYRPAQYMFRPGAQHPDWYHRWVGEGPWIALDSLLTDFPDDLSSLPTPSTRNKRDPFGLEGVVGAFNRAYQDWDLLISEYDLPYSSDGERYHLVGARSVAGMGPIGDGLVYSHHAHDPAFGQACTAFDLVRLHRFGDLDEKQSPQTPINRRKSYAAMLDLASVDARVTAEIVGADFDEEDPDWRTRLRRRPRSGDFVDCIENWDLIRENDPVFSLLYFNDLYGCVESSDDLPWRPLERGGPTFSSIDMAALSHYLERSYGYRPPRYLVEDLVATRAQQRWVDPIREYLESLEWDGQKRIDTCLPGVRSTPYTRMVARKSMVAAAARVLDPGCKWDHVLVLYGDEGLGKTWWVEKVFRRYSATLGRITDKDTLLVMHRSWLMLADEGYSLRKADADIQKEFLTRTEDVFRKPYDREAVAHPRRCVFWSTTNDEIFLRRQEGNRRYLIVHCEKKVDFDKVTDEYVDQLWAEAVYRYRAGEKLFLEDLESLLAGYHRERFTEADVDTGIIENYLETRVPADWDQMSPDTRKQWLITAADGLVQGTERIDRVCSLQVWVEAYGNPIGQRDRMGLLNITNALKKMPGWRQVPGRTRVPQYGTQMVFVRTESIEDLI